MTPSPSLSASCPDLSVGTALPELTLPVTATLVVAGAIATRDFQTVHHDRDAATAGGVPDIFMNILTTNALVNRYVCAWAGLSGRVTRIDIRLGAPCFPGDALVFSGEVTDCSGDRVRLAVAGRHGRGAHVTGAVELVFSDGEPRTGEPRAREQGEERS